MVCAWLALCVLACVGCCVMGELFAGMSDMVIEMPCSGMLGVLCWEVFVVFVVEL